MELLNPAVVTMLSQMQQVFATHKINYYLAGALARDVQFKNKHSNTNFRKTDDVDLAVCLSNETEFNDLVAALEATGNFKQIQKNPIKLNYYTGIEVDLIPYGAI